MLTVSDLKEACEAIEQEYGSDANIIIQIRDAEGSLINGTYVESMTRDSSGTLYLRGHRKDCVKNSIKLPDNVLLRTSPFVEENKAYLLKVGEDVLKPRIGFDRREECPYYEEDLGCSECAAEHFANMSDEEAVDILRGCLKHGQLIMGRGNGKMTGTLKLIRAMSKGIEALEERK